MVVSNNLLLLAKVCVLIAKVRVLTNLKQYHKYDFNNRKRWVYFFCMVS